MKRSFFSLLALMLVSLASPAAAQVGDANEARQMFERGIEAARQGNFAEAIDHFRRSFAIVERPSTAYNLAVALEHQGRVREALAALDDYARLAVRRDPLTREAQALRRQLEGRLVRLVLRISPPDAEVAIDGVVREGAGEVRELVLDPGTYSLRITAEGHAPRELSLTLESGARNEEIALGPEEEVAADGDTPEPSEQVVETPPPAPRGDPPERVAGWAILGAGAAAMITGGIFLGLGQAAASNVENAPRDTFYPDIAEDAARADWMRVAGWVLAGVGVVAAAAGITIALTAPSGSSERVTLRIGVGELALAWGGQ